MDYEIITVYHYQIITIVAPDCFTFFDFSARLAGKLTSTWNNRCLVVCAWWEPTLWCQASYTTDPGPAPPCPAQTWPGTGHGSLSRRSCDCSSTLAPGGAGLEEKKKGGRGGWSNPRRNSEEGPRCDDRKRLRFYCFRHKRSFPIYIFFLLPPQLSGGRMLLHISC